MNSLYILSNILNLIYIQVNFNLFKIEELYIHISYSNLFDSSSEFIKKNIRFFPRDHI